MTPEQFWQELQELVPEEEANRLYDAMSELVHRCKSMEASIINNQGELEQIRYLFDSRHAPDHPNDLKAWIDDLLAEQETGWS